MQDLIKTRLAVAGVAIVVAFFAGQLAFAQNLSWSARSAAEQGKPLFVAVVAPNDPPSDQLLQLIANDPVVKKLLWGKYVLAQAQANDPELKAWFRQYPPRNMSYPMLYIIAPRGQVLFNNSGVPQGDEFAKLLASFVGGEAALAAAQPAAPAAANAQAGGPANAQEAQPGGFMVPGADGQLHRAGGPPPPAIEQEDRGLAPPPLTEEQLAQAVKTANRALLAKRPAVAVAAVAPLLSRMGEIQASPHPIAKRFVDLVSKLEQQAQQELQAAAAKIEDENTLLYGLLALVKAAREYAPLPAARRAEALVDTAHRLKREELTQAEAIDKGRAKEDAGDVAGALAVYRQFLEHHPGTLGARLCQTRIDQLQAAGKRAPRR